MQEYPIQFIVASVFSFLTKTQPIDKYLEKTENHFMEKAEACMGTYCFFVNVLEIENDLINSYREQIRYQNTCSLNNSDVFSEENRTNLPRSLLGLVTKIYKEIAFLRQMESNKNVARQKLRDRVNFIIKNLWDYVIVKFTAAPNFIPGIISVSLLSLCFARYYQNHAQVPVILGNCLDLLRNAIKDDNHPSLPLYLFLIALDYRLRSRLIDIKKEINSQELREELNKFTYLNIDNLLAKFKDDESSKSFISQIQKKMEMKYSLTNHFIPVSIEVQI